MDVPFAHLVTTQWAGHAFPDVLRPAAGARRGGPITKRWAYKGRGRRVDAAGRPGSLFQWGPERPTPPSAHVWAGSCSTARLRPDDRIGTVASTTYLD
jgi:hypothetical protein